MMSSLFSGHILFVCLEKIGQSLHILSLDERHARSVYNQSVCFFSLSVGKSFAQSTPNLSVGPCKMRRKCEDNVS